jgi:YesN/AraC family two-component response regulator
VESKQHRQPAREVRGPVSSLVLTFLEQHYARDLTLAEIARSTFLTPNYLSTLFKRETGSSIVEALAQIRVEQATHLLMEHNLPLAEVARAVGYNNLDRFSRVFRKHKGVAPRYYGKNTGKI